VIIGVDPGLKGAIAFLSSKTGALLAVKDMPTTLTQVGKNMRKRIAPIAFCKLIQDSMAGGNVVEMVVIEQVQGFSGDAASTAFVFGYGAGLVAGCVVGLGLPFRRVTPHRWKKAAGLAKDKNLARAKAKELWPDHAKKFAREMDDGRAEAALIAFHYYTNKGI
jgi:hypothetical protein